MSKLMNLVGTEGLVIMVIYTLIPVSIYRFIEFEVLNSLFMFLAYLLISVCVFAYIERDYMDRGIAFTLCIVPFSYGILNMIAAETETLWIKIVLLIFSITLYIFSYAFVKENFVETD